MNLNHVLAFHKVAVAGSFTVASRLGGVSQPTLSAQVRALERTAGVPLLERGGRGIRLTAAGQELFTATRKLAEAIDEVGRVLASSRVPARGHLRIAADSAVHVLPVLAELKKGAAPVSFSLHIDNSAAVMARVLSDDADLGIMARATTDPRLFALKIREDRLVLLVPTKDPLAQRKRLKLGDLAGRDLVIRERGSITREVAEAQLKSSGVRTGQVFDVATREAVNEAVASGFGIGLAFASEVGRDPRMAAVPIRGADVSVAEYAICLSERRGLGSIGRFLEAARRLAQRSRWITEQDKVGSKM